MRREEGHDVTGRGGGREGTGAGEVMGSKARRTFSEDLSPRTDWKSPERSEWVGDHLQTLKAGGDGFGLGSVALAGEVVSLPPN